MLFQTLFFSCDPLTTTLFPQRSLVPAGLRYNFETSTPCEPITAITLLTLEFSSTMATMSQDNISTITSDTSSEVVPVESQAQARTQQAQRGGIQEATLEVQTRMGHR